MRSLTQWIAISLLILMIAGCGSSLKMDSRWRDREIAIDGVLEEWQGGTTFIEKEGVVVGFFNDHENLYVCLATSERLIQRQIMMMGFTLWLDPQGGKSRDFGIKFPVGMMETASAMRGRMENEGFGGMRDMLEKSLAELEIFDRKDGGALRMKVSEAKGVEVKVTGFPQNLVYEIKIPLQENENHPFAINAKAEQPIGVGFETAKLDRQAMLENSGRGGSRSGRTGRPRGGGGRRGGFGGAGGPQQMQAPFQLWVSVSLGQENQRTSAKTMQDENAYAPTPVDPLPEQTDRPLWRDLKDGAPQVGEMAPRFTLKSLDGNSETSLASFHGQKPVVLFFGSYT